MLVQVDAAESKAARQADNVDEILESLARAIKVDGERLRSDRHFESLRELVHGMLNDGRGRADPVRETFARLGDKWSSLLLFLLRSGPYRHSALRRLVSVIAVEREISQRMLTLRLRNLERDGFIHREIDGSVPPRVEYSLTPLGRALADRAMMLIRWVGDHAEQVEQARAAFDERHRGDGR